MISGASGQRPRLASDSLKRGEVKDRRGRGGGDWFGNSWPSYWLTRVERCHRERGQHCLCAVWTEFTAGKKSGCGCPLVKCPSSSDVYTGLMPDIVV